MSTKLTDLNPGQYSSSVCAGSSDCVKVLDEHGKIQFFNEDGLRLMEIADVALVMGNYWPDLWPDSERATVEAGISAARSTGVATFTAFCPTAMGTPKWWEVTIAAVPGIAASFVVISRDVTAQRDKRLATDDNHDRLQSILGSTPDVLWDIDLTTGTIWWSDGMASIFSYSPDQIGDGTAWFHDHIHAHDRARVVTGMETAVTDGSMNWEDEFRFRKADGDYLEVLDRGAIIRDSGGKALRFVGVMQDISVRNAAAAVHKLVAGELAHRVNNILAVVTGLFQQSVRSAVDMETLSRSFSERLLAMANANNAIAKGSGVSAQLHALVKAQLAPFVGAGRLVVTGPVVELPMTIVQPIALALNELATNALKYGALSNAIGRVDLAWHIQAGDGGETLILQWREHDGPPVAEPTRRGVGTTLIERGIPRARASRRFDANGFNCTLEIPLR